MKYLGTMVVVLGLLLYGAMALASSSQKTPSPTTPKQQRIILVNNPYPDRVKVTYLCVYRYDNPWKGECEKITKKHPGFYLHDDENMSDIQRIGLIGESLEVPGAIAECLVHYDVDEKEIKRLDNSKNYIAEVNYVAGRDMVCSLLTKTQ